MSKRSNIRGTSVIVGLKRDEILQVGRLTVTTVPLSLHLNN